MLQINIFFRSALVGVLATGLTAVSQASPISGSIGLGTGTVYALDQSNNFVTSLSLMDQFQFGIIPFLGTNSFLSSSTGDFAIVPLYTGIDQSTLNVQALTTYTWTSAFMGSFQAGVIHVGANTFTPYATMSTNVAGQTVLNVYEYGVFTPGGFLAPYTPTNMIETLSFTQTGTGTAMSCSATALAVVPEPCPLVVVGGAVLGLFLRRRRANR